MTRDEINAFGEALKAELLDGDDLILIDIAALGYDTDTGDQSIKVTVGGYVTRTEYETFTGHAVYLHDAVCLARGKFRKAKENIKNASAKSGVANRRSPRRKELPEYAAEQEG